MGLLIYCRKSADLYLATERNWRDNESVILRRSVTFHSSSCRLDCGAAPKTCAHLSPHHVVVDHGTEPLVPTSTVAALPIMEG